MGNKFRGKMSSEILYDFIVKYALKMNMSHVFIVYFRTQYTS